MIDTSRRLAFTLVEMLVVIAIIAILIALVLPLLAGSRRSASQLKSTSNLKTIGQTLHLYANLYESYPFGQYGYTRPPEVGGEPVVLAFNIWLLDRHWPVLMHDVAPWQENYQCWISPGDEATAFARSWNDDSPTFVTNTTMSSYRYSTSFVATAETWDPESTGGHLGAARPSDVFHPSNKVIMYDASLAYLGSRVHDRSTRPCLAVDGSASSRYDDLSFAPVQNHLYDRSPTLYQDTRLGIQGRDLP